jgi:hypothetical protein
MPTNFDLAPPTRIVDGLSAVPIDIQQITAALTFDGASSSGTGDATVDFIVGPGGGCPIFDLRQTITAVWLDGVPLTLSDVALHDFGGGAGAELRVVNAVLADGTSHTLRVTYTLGTPQASIAGSYQPAMTWSSGPRLAFNFGFTDLGPGRYLESWIPANLIFDQFGLALELRVLNTAVAHTPITNGVVTSVGVNHWSVAFPSRFTALSHLLELRAVDAVTSQTASTVLPGSGATIQIEAWKLAGSTVDLAARLADIGVFLAANESSAGPYLHGGRFVAFLHTGGMEYDGGTTTSMGALQHETFHSWWGRGLKPAGQADGWWDEAWTVYNDAGASGSVPFNFANAPVELSSRNPWMRRTPSASYTSGRQFFEGAASLIGPANLKSHMAGFFADRHARPATTVQLEEFLVARSSDPTLVDAFHRFVYGFSDPSPAPDLWIKDDSGHTGEHLWAGTFWNSPDLWIRNADDGGTTQQPPEFGQDNWFHARVRNRSASGTARHFVVTFNVKPWAGTEFVYPGDFLPATAAVAEFDLGPGDTRIVKARWPRALVAPNGTHVCWLAAVLSRSDHPGSGLHVWEHNNLAQKNLIVVDVLPNRWWILPFVVDRLKWPRPRPMTFQLRLPPPRWGKLEAALLHGSDIFAQKARSAAALLRLDERGILRRTPEPLECGGAPDPQFAAEELLLQGLGRAFPAGRTPRVSLTLPGRGQLLMGLAVRVPESGKPRETIALDLLQWDDRRKRVTGGLAVLLRVRARRRAR